jgi:DNA invertase Pin-like site-specific DNA recombinase
MAIVIYTRVSTTSQSENGSGLSAQEHACKSVANTGNNTITGIYTDVASSTSPLDKREGLTNAINALNKGDVLLVAKRDRLGRDPLVIAMIEASVARRGATVQTAAGEGNGNNPSDALMRRVVDAVAEYELSEIKARTKAALQAKKRKNERTGTIPFGKMLDVDGIHLIDNPNERAIIAMVISQRKSGLSLRQISDNLNERNITKRKGAKWNHVNLHTILKNANMTARY